MRLVLMGPPGAGKGTQAQLAAETLGVPKLSTGDMLRAEVKAESDIGKEVADCINRGDLVSDELIMSILAKRITKPDCKTGFVLDGLPRTVAQAQALDKVLSSSDVSLDAIVNLKVAEEDLIKRFTGRRVALGSGRTYHVEHNPPKVDGKCDETGEDLVQRQDDKEDVVRHRLNVYREQTAPVVEFYRNQGRLKEIDGMGSVDEVFADLCTAMGLTAASAQQA